MEPRIAAMVAQIARIEVTLTRTEAEALLLEAQLIKCSSRATTSCCATTRAIPYIYLSGGEEYPRHGVSPWRKQWQGDISVRIPVPMPCAKA